MKRGVEQSMAKVAEMAASGGLRTLTSGARWLAAIAFNVLLSLSLAFGYVPLVGHMFDGASVTAAYADDDGDADDDGGSGGDQGGSEKPSGGDSGGDSGSGSGGESGGSSGGGNSGGDTGGGSGGDSGSGSGGGNPGGGDSGSGGSGGGNTGGDTGDGGGSGDGGSGGGSGGGEPEVDPGQPEKYYVDTLLLKWDKPDAQGQTHFVGDNAIVEKSYKKVKVSEFGETVQLNGYYLSTDGTGVAYQTADGSTAIGSFDLDWKSSDESVATVDPSGLVTPKGKNGEVVITATVADSKVYQGEAPKATVTIVFDGQDGKYVVKVEILDENGKVIGEDWGGVTVYNEQNAFHQLQARVTWHNVKDGTETVEVTGSGDTYKASNVDTTITWSVSSSNTFTINRDTGRLKTGSYSGNAYVVCSAVGGLGGKTVEDTANVQVDTGSYEYNPADSLTLKVVWEERPDEVVKEKTYSYAELLSTLSTRKVNASIVNSSRFGVITAEGFLFKDVVDLVSVDDADVLQYRFGTADGYDNPVSYQYLFESGNRYYFPNYEVGKSRADAQIVPPILAYRSTLVWNKSEADPNAKLDDGTRFRLVFGCLASGDANTSFQIYYIDTITIVLKGAPSAGGQGGSGTGKDSGTGGGSGGGAGGGGGDGSGGSGGGKAGASDKGGSDNGQGDKKKAGAERSSGKVADVAGGETEDAAETAESADAGGDAGTSKRWRVYQMMNKTNSDVPDWDDENPISPFAAPIAFGTFAVGMGATGIGFRRRLR